MNDAEIKPYTTDEVRSKFIEATKTLIRHWSHTTPPPDIAAQEALMTQSQIIESRVSGMVHSLFAMLDGNNGSMPGFKVIPCPHVDDREFNIKNGTQYYSNIDDLVDAPTIAIIDSLDIAGSLRYLK